MMMAWFIVVLIVSSQQRMYLYYNCVMFEPKMWLDFLILFMFEILDNMHYLDMLLVNILRAKFSQMAIDL